MILGLVSLAACTQNQPISQLKSSVETSIVKYFGNGTFEQYTHAMMADEENAAGLDSIVSVFDYDNRTDLICDTEDNCRLEEVIEKSSICIKGDINQVCSLLSKMSQVSDSRYTDGDHVLSTLAACRVMGSSQPVEARFTLSSDYSDKTVQVTQIFNTCESYQEPAVNQCIFGESVDFSDSSRFQAREVALITAANQVAPAIEQQLIAGMIADGRLASNIEEAIAHDDEGEVTFYRLTDRVTGSVYHWFAFYAGDNPMGFITEAHNTSVVAIIGDGDFSSCSVRE
jgi:hypothetical protein